MSEITQKSLQEAAMFVGTCFGVVVFFVCLFFCCIFFFFFFFFSFSVVYIILIIYHLGSETKSTYGYK